MNKAFIGTVVLFLASGTGVAQLPGAPRAVVGNGFASVDEPKIDLPGSPLPRMAPELALQMYQQRSVDQALKLAEYTDKTLVQAELPDTRQKGEYELVRNYSAQPRQLTYQSIKFTGDSFVKTNVITRVLQSEVDHVEKGDPATSAINETNYKFSYKGTEELNGRQMHVFQIKPRRKDPSLFKGKIFVDAYTGSLRRAEGTVSKSPSFFVRKIEFVQDFDDIGGFTMPVAMRSTAKARIIGKTIVNVFHRAYDLHAQNSSNALMGNQ